MFKKQFFISLFIVGLSIVSINAQSLLYKISIEDQIKQSSLIIEGRIVEKQAYISSVDNHIYTINKIEVSRIFKGEKQNFVNVITKGGSVGFNKEEVRPSLQLRRNTIGVFMLKTDTNEFIDFKTSNNMYHAYSDMQGFYKYDVYENTVSNPYYSFLGIEEMFYKSLTDITDTNTEILNYNLSNTRASKDLLTNTINSFAPEEVRSGIGETVTISGADFGSVPGTVQFLNADNGGFSFESVFDSEIESWSDTSITVVVPSIAGTGNIRIITADGDTIVSDEELIVLSSELNAAFGDFPEESFRAKLHDSDGEGGYTWTYNNDFFNNSAAVEAFERSIRTWRCATGISWLVSDVQSDISGTNSDGVNIVAFASSQSAEISFGVLAVTTTYYLGCANGNTVTSYVSEVDMLFNSDFDWHFGLDDPGMFENDFQGTATHELGHAHNLGHVIAPTNLMHFETSSGLESATRDVDEDSQIGASLNFEFSKTSGLCGEDSVRERECGDDSVRIIINYPVTEILDLRVNELKTVEYSFLLYDIHGRLLDSRILTMREELIDVSHLDSGIYVVKVITGTETDVQKFVIF